MSATFFYGTLMHPAILKRVIGNEAEHLQVCSAVLLDYTRHHVKGQDYPGIVPWSKGRAFFDNELGHDARSVRGTLVVGLSDADIYFLDVFEGSEYTRENVQVHPLGSLVSISEYSVSPSPSVPPPLPAKDELEQAIGAQTYVFRDISALEPSLWSYEDFVQRNAWRWYGSAGDERRDIIEVDKVRERLQVGSSEPLVSTVSVVA
ncbi:hypothetical protein C8J56DRAFT_930596 [Mycena floridula]|nr:hypothetical protein C8J56DRAFT_930596 [Mycena floridula]